MAATAARRLAAEAAGLQRRAQRVVRPVGRLAALARALARRRQPEAARTARLQAEVAQELETSALLAVMARLVECG